MSFIEQHSIPIIFVLFFIILLLVAVILFLYRRINRPSYEGDAKYSKDVPIEKHKEILENRDYWRKKYEELKTGISDNTDYLRLQDDYEKACVEIGKLKNQIDELKRDKNELNELYDKSTRMRGETPTIKKQGTESASSKNGPQIIRYASFPRSAGSNIYFSDLTDSLADDSYFELKFSDGKDVAVFKPLDFMKIRNYDPAMAAMTTEGVKPNMASTILGIEPGKAHLEGKDWIIDKPAIIKLA